MNQHTDTPFPPDWSLQRPKSVLQSLYDLVGAPLRMALLPDHISEKLHLTSLRAERFAVVLPEMRGRVLDVGAGDNILLKAYIRRHEQCGSEEIDAVQASVGVDVVDWGGGTTMIERSDDLPFQDESFDTVLFIACLNHIPEREGALRETLRVLKPGGRVVMTMIGKRLGDIGHAIWWYSEDKHRDVDEDEVMGIDSQDMLGLMRGAGFVGIQHRSFVYGLNHLFIGHKAADSAGDR